MSHNISPQLLQHVLPLNLKKYLIGKGWEEVSDFPRKDVWLFNDTRTAEQVLIPKDNKYELYTSDILQVAGKLQRIEQRDIGLIITQLQRPDVDIVRYRIQSPQIESGTLPLNAISKFIDNVVNSFKAALSDCINPNLHHPRMGGTRLDQLLEQSQFGQTEHGSYVVKIITPAIQEGQSLLFSNELKANDIRKGVVHLLKSTNEIIRAIEQESTEQFVQDNRQRPTISDNFLNAITDMQLSDDISLEITSDWSPIIPIPIIPSSVKIQPEYFSEISAISNRLSPKSEDIAAETLTGYVTRLDGDANNVGKPEGEVLIHILTPDQGSFSVVAVLNQDDYQIAVDAHRNTIPVIFSGKLIRKSVRRREVIEIHNFSLSKTKSYAGMKPSATFSVQ